MQKMQREELLIGILAATTANSGFARPRTPVSAEAFMLHPFPPKPVTGEDIMRAFAHMPKTGAPVGRKAIAGETFG